MWLNLVAASIGVPDEVKYLRSDYDSYRAAGTGDAVAVRRLQVLRGNPVESPGTGTNLPGVWQPDLRTLLLFANDIRM